MLCLTDGETIWAIGSSKRATLVDYRHWAGRDVGSYQEGWYDDGGLSLIRIKPKLAKAVELYGGDAVRFDIEGTGGCAVAVPGKAA